MRVRIGLFFVKLGFRILGAHDVADAIRNRRVDQRVVVSTSDMGGGDFLGLIKSDGQRAVDALRGAGE